VDEPGPHLRASDADRERVAGQLRTSLGEGRLTLGEFDERVAAVYAARTYGDLIAVTSDLPAPRVELGKVERGIEAQPGIGGRDRRPARRDRHAGRSAARRTPLAAPLERAVWGSYLATNLMLIVIWALSNAGGYPWFLWVAGPWGAVLVAREIQHRLP
jgi:hypothetical protein